MDEIEPYSIVPGDTLSHIARVRSTTVQHLAETNAVQNPDLIYAGETLIVPAKQQDIIRPQPRPAHNEAVQPIDSAKTTPEAEKIVPESPKAANDAVEAGENRLKIRTPKSLIMQFVIA